MCTVVSAGSTGAKQGDQRHVDEDNGILGLVGDERDLFAGQPDVQVCSTAPMHGAAK